MELKKIIELIKSYFSENQVKVKSMYLFGSRGREDYNEDSDYDFMVVLNENKTNEEKRKISKGIRNYLSNNKMLLNMDFIIKNNEVWEWESNNFGFLAYTVKNEGRLV